MRRGVTLALLLAAGFACACRRGDHAKPQELRAQIASLEKERTALRGKLDALLESSPLFEGMPSQAVRVGVPTALARDLITRVATGFVDRITLELRNLTVRKSGTVKRIVTLGEYQLDVKLRKITGNLKTGTPQLTFGGNQVGLQLPVKVVSGIGEATIHFKWDGKNLSDAVCGDMEIDQNVSGGVIPATYPVSGAIVLKATTREILAEPKLPPTRLRLRVKPTEQSWAAVQKIVEDKEGVCGYVLDKVNLLKIVQDLIDRGFNVRLPVEKIKPLALPVGIEPAVRVQGKLVELSIKVGGLAVTKEMIWLGADVVLEQGVLRRTPLLPPARSRE